MDKSYFNIETDIAWCEGCGDFGLRTIMMEAMAELNLKKSDICFVSGIGQAAKSPQYYDVSYFNGLHGRALPAAIGIKASNPNLKVIVQSGDGDMYGEGGNHFIHSARRNSDITVIVHNNMIYGLTKGQASPTTGKGMKTPIQIGGVSSQPVNPVALAITMGATFVARGSVGEKQLTKNIIKAAINHKGFALVDVFQACVSFNKLNTHKWYKDNSSVIPDSHEVSNKMAALELAFQENPLPLGIFYENSNMETFEDFLYAYKKSKEPLYKRNTNIKVLREIMTTKKYLYS